MSHKAYIILWMLKEAKSHLKGKKDITPIELSNHVLHLNALARSARVAGQNWLSSLSGCSAYHLCSMD
jgi:hypothetical protein